MQLHGIQARAKRKYKATTDSKHSLPVAAELLQRNFNPLAPDRAWSSDITYIAAAEGWLYLAVMIDLFSRQVVGRSMKPHMRTELVLNAQRMAWFRRRSQPGLTHLLYGAHLRFVHVDHHRFAALARCPSALQSLLSNPFQAHSSLDKTPC